MTGGGLGDPSCTNCMGVGYTNHGRHPFPGCHSRPRIAVMCDCAEQRLASEAAKLEEVKKAARLNPADHGE